MTDSEIIESAGAIAMALLDERDVDERMIRLAGVLDVLATALPDNTIERRRLDILSSNMRFDSQVDIEARKNVRGEA